MNERTNLARFVVTKTCSSGEDAAAWEESWEEVSFAYPYPLDILTLCPGRVLGGGFIRLPRHPHAHLHISPDTIMIYANISLMIKRSLYVDDFFLLLQLIEPLCILLRHPFSTMSLKKDLVEAFSSLDPPLPSDSR